jgi:hypothetical protein
VCPYTGNQEIREQGNSCFWQRSRWPAPQPPIILNGRWQLDAAHSPDADRPQSETLAITQKADSIAISDVITDSNGKERKPISSATLRV